MNKKLFNDFVAFGREHILSDDIDPAYPVIRHLILEFPIETQLWFLALYLSYYNLSSALIAFRAIPGPKNLLVRPEVLKLACATERRGLRGGKVADNIESYLCLCKNGQAAFITAGWNGTPKENYLKFWETSQKVWGNGRWATFKWGELLKDILGWPLESPDLRLKHCSGPRAGLEMIMELRGAPVSQLERASVLLKERANEAGLDTDWEDIETILCDFHSLSMGGYYLGHDIDSQQEQIARSPISSQDRDLLFAIRSKVFRPEYLGEIGGWTGVQSERKKLYKSDGMVVMR